MYRIVISITNSRTFSDQEFLSCMQNIVVSDAKSKYSKENDS